MAAPPASSPRRTSTRASLRSRCAERRSPGASAAAGDGDSPDEPVRLVVFDFDETLTLMTFKIEDDDSREVRKEIVRVNFETPWVQGCRVEKLRKMLDSIEGQAPGPRRALAVLTRNCAGAMAVLTLLREAGLARHFTALWTMPWRASSCNGLFQQDGEWHQFDPPVNVVADHKADVLNHVAANPSAWFPQLATSGEDWASELRRITLRGIVLVDDQRANFQSSSGAQVLRYCKVARYDSQYRNLGHVKNMGGLGAHLDEDYNTLCMFVEAPSMCQETLQLQCVERYFEGCEERPPVALVVFDFDETLTLATFMPDGDDIAESILWSPESLEGSDWSQEELLQYNFETPYVTSGARLWKLRALLRELRGSAELGYERTLAVLSRNESGAVAVLNLLRMAGLADYFAAIWTMPYSPHRPCGAYRSLAAAGQEAFAGAGDGWRSFEPPLLAVAEHKADVLRHVTEHPEKWFPQLRGASDGAGGAGGAAGGAAGAADAGDGLRRMLHLRPESVVLIDDERANFSSDLGSEATVLRYCKVARYDEDYRCCGPLNQMGGIGAHSDDDFETLRTFVESPWVFSQATSADVASSPRADDSGVALPPMRRNTDDTEELGKAPRWRRFLKKSLSWSAMSQSPRESFCKRSNSFCASPRTEQEDELCDTAAAVPEFNMSWEED